MEEIFVSKEGIHIPISAIPSWMIEVNNEWNIDAILWTWFVALIVLLGCQRNYFSDWFHPPPCVPEKNLNDDVDRPMVRVLFRPDEDNTATSSNHTTATNDSSTPKTARTMNDLLPDSFAPLLSSSNMEVLYDGLEYANLLHACHVRGSIQLKKDQSIEIPLDVTHQRPQFTICPSECKISFSCSLGSDGWTSQQDLSINEEMFEGKKRSHAMIKDVTMSLDQPLPLKNVASTLFTIPSLFSRTKKKKKRSFLWWNHVWTKYLSIWIEKCLSCCEQKCQIHLSKVQISPFYASDDQVWKCNLAFSGHVLLFQKIPIPFIHVTLPSFIIPNLHALLPQLLSSNPLASTQLILTSEQQKDIMLAISHSIDTFQMSMQAVAIPPSLSIDWTLPGGLTVAIETSTSALTKTSGSSLTRSISNTSLTSSNILYTHPSTTSTTKTKLPIPVDFSPAQYLVPWSITCNVNGSLDNDSVYVSLKEFKLCQGAGSPSQISLSGNIVLQKPQLETLNYHNHTKSNNASSPRNNIMKTPTQTISHASTHHYPTKQGDTPSVISVLLSPLLSSSTSVNRKIYNLLKYDYSLDIDTMQLDTMTVSIGAYHPMLKGGTMITTVLESIYSYGSLAAREGAIMDMNEIHRKRNILRHLPAIDLTAGIQNLYIPEDSNSYSDDGQTKCEPQLSGGRMMVHVIGGIQSTNVMETETNTISVDQLSTSFLTHHSNYPQDLSSSNIDKKDSTSNRSTSNKSNDKYIEEGIKVVVDFGVASFSLINEGHVNEFPELEIFEEDKLYSLLSGNLNGRIACLLRPLSALATASGIGRNIFNPLEAYEIVFSGSHVSLCMKEANATLGHRRLIIPTESKFNISIVESIVDMSFDGKTQCEVHWDFQGSSPILQVTAAGQTPANVSHEDRKQVSLLISSLRQGRFNLNVSSVGGITITEAKTTRANGEGLYDWKFFNAIFSPDEESPQRLFQVLHDKRSMNKLLQVVDLVNTDLGKLMKYILKQVWRAKEILDQEGVSDPGQAIPGQKMARLVSLFLCGDVSEVNIILPLIRRIVSGDGLDVVKTKELLRKKLSIYEDWAPEIDRAVRWAEVMLGPMEAEKPYVENEVYPLSELQHYEQILFGIPSAKEIYTSLLDKPQLPLDESFSNLVGELAPYLTFNQVEYILRIRPSSHWQPLDLRRLRYVYAIKRKVLEISESYGGISFLPQSFFVSVFVGESSRASLRSKRSKSMKTNSESLHKKSIGTSMMSTLRQRRISSPTAKMSHPTFTPELQFVVEDQSQEFLSPAGRVASRNDVHTYFKTPIGNRENHRLDTNSDVYSDVSFESEMHDGSYELGDSLLGPQDVAILLQAGLTSPMKNSTVVQLNQRMLLDLMASQPKSFALAVLSEIGTPGVSHSSPRAMTSALMALLDLDQSSFREFHRLDMHALLESWLPGLKIPKREDYLAGGRWARQSYYNAIFGVAKNILEDAESYFALKSKVQRVRQSKESDPIPETKEKNLNNNDDSDEFNYEINVPFKKAVDKAKGLIDEADRIATGLLQDIKASRKNIKNQGFYTKALELYNDAFTACAQVLKLDKLSFQSNWFKSFYRRNYDALMVKSIYDNVQENVDDVRAWLDCMNSGVKANEKNILADSINPILSLFLPREEHIHQTTSSKCIRFSEPEKYTEQELIDGIIDLVFYDKNEAEYIRNDPLVRLLISNPPGNYNLTIVTAMGVITDGQQGLELDTAFARLKKKRGVCLVRSDTGTARSLEYNASKIEEAIQNAISMGKPYGLLGYSQGCANALTAESSLLSGTPLQQRSIRSKNGLVCRQLLFSAANGSMHGPAMDSKANRLIMMCEEFFKYQQGYCSKAFIRTVLEMLTNFMDSPSFQKFVCGGGGTFLHEGNKSFWREAQHLPHVPTCVLRGVLENHTTPESLEMISNLLTKQAGSALHDSQVHVYDAVGYPVYTQNRNGKILKKCDMGGAIQRTHHWSPLSDEVDFVKTKRDEELGSFICAKDRHVFPWLDVNARFGIVQYTSNENDAETLNST